MKYEKYISLIKDLETQAARNPQEYRRRVIALGLLGYAYFIGIAAAALLIPVAFVLAVIVFPQILLIFLKFLFIKAFWLIAVLGIFMIGFVWTALRALFVGMPAPEGYELTRDESPKLFEMTDKAASLLNTPRPDAVLLNDEFNASVVTVPRFLFFGRKTYLNIGLPLMQALSPQQFRAVVAHEFGHLSENHGKYSAWIYRLHETWARFVAAQEANGQQLSFLYARFLNWYFPYFSAYAFVLRREQEREADRCAVKLVGATHTGEALISAELNAFKLQNKFWREVLDEAANSPQPPRQIFSRMATTFRQSNDSANDVLQLTKALSIRTDYNDPHPSLGDRLRGIGYWRGDDASAELPALPSAAQDNAAEHFLKGKTAQFAAQFDLAWQSNVAHDWKVRHDFLQQAKERLEELEAGAAREVLSDEKMYERAALVAEIKGEEAALPHLREIVALHPENAAANFSIGALLLHDGDETGIDYLKTAMRIDVQMELEVCERIFAYLQARGREDEARPFLVRAEELYEVYTAAQTERATVSDRDIFEPDADLPTETIQKIREICGWNEEIVAAYLVRKRVRHMPEVPCRVLCLKLGKRWLPQFGSGVSEDDLLDAVGKQVGALGINYVIVLNSNFPKANKQIKKLGAQVRIYQT